MPHLLRTSANLCAAVGLVCLLVLSAAILADALSRSFLNAPIYGLSDLLEIVTPVIVASCFPLALLNQQNITIRFLGRALPARAGQIVEAFGQLLALVAFSAIVWQLASYTAGLIRYNQFTWLLRVPIWPSWILATLLMAVCVPIQAGNLVACIKHIRDGDLLRDTLVEPDLDADERA